MTKKEFGIVRLADNSNELLEDGMFISDEKLSKLDGKSVRYLITHGRHRDACMIDDALIWNGMHINNFLKEMLKMNTSFGYIMESLKIEKHGNRIIFKED